jgi:hypothetical protein
VEWISVRRLFAEAGEDVQVFLTGRGVDAENLGSERFKITEMMHDFVDAGGRILACGTCLKLRSREGTALCPVSNMRTMLEIIRQSDKVLTFCRDLAMLMELEGFIRLGAFLAALPSWACRFSNPLLLPHLRHALCLCALHSKETARRWYTSIGALV